MDLWVIDYALHVNSMKDEAYSSDDVAGFRDVLDACLAARGFERLEGLGFHASAKPEAISDAYLACSDVSAIDGSERFISKLNLFRVNNVTDLLPFVSSDKASSNDRMREQIVSEYRDVVERPDSDDGLTVASAVAAVVQDLFLDGPGQSDHKPPLHRTKTAPAAKPG